LPNDEANGSGKMLNHNTEVKAEVNAVKVEMSAQLKEHYAMLSKLVEKK